MALQKMRFLEELELDKKKKKKIFSCQSLHRLLIEGYRRVYSPPIFAAPCSPMKILERYKK
jgi:hypothetical protein